MRRRFLALPPVERGLLLMWMAGFVGGLVMGVAIAALWVTVII